MGRDASQPVAKTGARRARPRSRARHARGARGRARRALTSTSRSSRGVRIRSRSPHGSRATRRARSATASSRAVNVDGRQSSRAHGSPPTAPCRSAPSPAGVERLRWLLALDDDHSDFLRPFARPDARPRRRARFAGLRPVRVATVAQALLRAFCGQLIEAKRARRLEQTIIRTLCAGGTRASRAPTTRELGALAPSSCARSACTPARRALVRICRVARARASARRARRRSSRRGSSASAASVRVARRRLPRGARPLRLRARRRPRARESSPRAARSPRSRLGDGRAARAVRRVGRPRERLPARRLARACPCQAALRSVCAMASGSRSSAAAGSARRSFPASQLRLGRHRRHARREERAAELASGTASRRRRRTPRRSPAPRRRHRREAAGHRRAARARSARCSTPEQTVVSVAAAIPTAHIEARIADGVPVVRAMPNAPAIVHEGMAGICAGAHAADEQLALAEDLLAHLGRVVRVPET